MVCELYLNLKTLKREERSQTKLLRFHLKLKKRKTKSKENKKKKIVKIRFEFDKIKNRKTIEKIMKTKVDFLK